jgi:hypothetical protein
LLVFDHPYPPRPARRAALARAGGLDERLDQGGREYREVCFFVGPRIHRQRQRLAVLVGEQAAAVPDALQLSQAGAVVRDLGVERGEPEIRRAVVAAGG